ncbi:MAG: hypothetical protein ACRDGT_11120 [Candidatus Limnocylindria bacterium]
MVEQDYGAITQPSLDREAYLRRELPARGVKPRVARALVLRLISPDGRRRTLAEIGRQEGYGKVTASLVLSKARDRLALSHLVQPLPNWLVRELEDMSPRRPPFAGGRPPELPVAVLRLRGLRIAALQRAGLRTVEEIQRNSDAELLALPGVGPRSLRQLRAVCAELLVSADAASPVGSEP